MTFSGSWRDWHGEEPIRLGISSCLLGTKVRFDGGHKRDRYITDDLGRWFDWVPVCPELEIGLGVPRPTIRLERQNESIRLVEPSSGRDLTDRMAGYAVSKVQKLQGLGLDGFLVKRASPSCGMERVKVFSKGSPTKQGTGIFTRVLMDRWPNLPVEEEGRLNDPGLRERFIEHVFCAHRWRQLVQAGLNRRRLVAFHTAHKMILRAHNEASYRRLGRIVAMTEGGSDDEVFERYEAEFHHALSRKATPKRHANVLYHILGYLKKVLDAFEKQEAVTQIEDYRQGLVPLIVPITLLRHHAFKHDIPYLKGQLYLDPHPKEMMLRNRV